MENELIYITFARHGRSRADDENVFEGRYDSPLTEVGKAQARARATDWQQKDISFDLIICSTLQRALTVAQIIADCLDVPLEPDADWMEMDNGPLAGLSYEDAEKRYPRPAFRNPYQPMAGSGESEIQLANRASRAVEKIVRRGPGRYLVVAHGGILNAALRSIVGAPYPINFHGIWFAFNDLGFARFSYDPSNHRWTMLELSA